MYAAVPCPNCGRNRIVNLDSMRSKCPYCGVVSETKVFKILYKAEAAKEVQEMLFAVTTPKTESKKKVDRDPMSTLQYRYEKAKSSSRLEILVQGLDEIIGTFTLDDVKLIDAENAETLVERMLHSLMVIEERPGRYRSCL